MLENITWKCQICGEIRPDDMIGVVTTDISEENGMRLGMMKMNTKYCKDKKECVESAKIYRLTKEK